MGCSYYQFKNSDFYCLKKNDYVNSDAYYKYCRGYSYSDCPIYKNASSSGGCYLTSACVYSKGLPDNCVELQTLRNYRDHWLRLQPDGEYLISEYYKIAPKIVSAINSQKDKISIYTYIYETMIEPCVKFINNSQMQDALNLYKQKTLELQETYC